MSFWNKIPPKLKQLGRVAEPGHWGMLGLPYVRDWSVPRNLVAGGTLGMLGGKVGSLAGFGIGGPLGSLAGAGLGYFTSGQGWRSLKTGWDLSYRGMLPFALPMAAYLGSQAAPGQEASTAVGFLAGGLPTIPGALIGGVPGAILSTALFSGPFSRWARMGAQTMADSATRIRRLEFAAPNYKDTQAAATMRQVAAREMAGSLLNSRQILGREAAFMHQ